MPQVQASSTSQILNVGQVETLENGMAQVNLGEKQSFRPPKPVPNREEEEYIGQHNPRLLIVHRNQDADQVLRHVEQNNFGGHNNIDNMVKHIFAQNGLNVGLLRPNFISPLSEYV